jgi:hypothetical protein
MEPLLSQTPRRKARLVLKLLRTLNCSSMLLKSKTKDRLYVTILVLNSPHKSPPKSIEKRRPNFPKKGRSMERK